MSKRHGTTVLPSRYALSILQFAECIFNGCYRKWLMLFSLKFQRDNRQNALSVNPAKGKTGEKGCIFTALWRWNNHKLEQSLFNKMPTVISHLIKRNCFISVFQEGCRPSCPQLSKIFYNHSTLYDKFCKLNLQRWSCVRCVVQNALNTW